MTQPDCDDQEALELTVAPRQDATLRMRMAELAECDDETVRCHLFDIADIGRRRSNFAVSDPTNGGIREMDTAVVGAPSSREEEEGRGSDQISGRKA